MRTRQSLKHSNVSRRRKLTLLDSLVFSKLRYASSSAWLSKSDLRRLDGFQANCLRKVLGIPSAYFSRVSNDRVRNLTGQGKFSTTVRKAQLKLLGDVLTNPDKALLKKVAFHGDTLVPETAAFVRRVGRPRQNWTEQLLGMTRDAAG